MEDKELTGLVTELERYQLIIDHYRANPLRVGPNREYLNQIGDIVLDLSPGSLFPRPERHFGAGTIELGPPILFTREKLCRLRKLLSQEKN